jgi:serine/threonine protein kinase
MAKVAPEEHLPEDVGHVVVHATVHKDLGSHHNEARETKLKDCTDEQILSELARRGVDVKHQITEESVKETYKFEKFLGEGASGQVHLVKHKKSGHMYACKVIKKDGKLFDLGEFVKDIATRMANDALLRCPTGHDTI